MALPYDASPVAMRVDLAAALNRNHERLAQTGSWLDGAHRLAVVIPLVVERAGPGCGHLQDRHRTHVGPSARRVPDNGDWLQNLHLEN